MLSLLNCVDAETLCVPLNTFPISFTETRSRTKTRAGLDSEPEKNQTRAGPDPEPEKNQTRARPDPDPDKD